MAQTTPNNIRTPEAGDLFNYVNDLQTLANDTQTALNTKVDKGPDPQDVDVVRDVKGGRDVKAGRDVSAGRNLTVTGRTQSKTVRIPTTTDLSLTSTGHGFQVGPDGGTNLGIDNNEIMARNNGKKSALHINGEGGNVSVGDGSSTVTVRGTFSNPRLPVAMASGLAGGVNIVAGGVTNVEVKFPAGRFTKAPVVTATIMGDARDVNVQVDNVTKDKFTLRRGSVGVVARSNIRASWTAIQEG